MLGPAAMHAAPRALLGKGAAASIVFIPLNVLIPAVQTTISTTTHLVESGIARGGNKLKKSNERKQYEKKDQ